MGKPRMSLRVKIFIFLFLVVLGDEGSATIRKSLRVSLARGRLSRLPTQGSTAPTAVATSID